MLSARALNWAATTGQLLKNRTIASIDIPGITQYSIPTDVGKFTAGTILPWPWRRTRWPRLQKGRRISAGMRPRSTSKAAAIRGQARGS